MNGATKYQLLRLLRGLWFAPQHNPYFDPAKPHHTPVGFRNNQPTRPPSGEDFARLQREMREAEKRTPPPHLACVTPDLTFLHANRSAASVTWIGHSTVLVQLAGRNVLTDPIFSSRASPLPFAGPKRCQPPGVALRELPHIDLVVISHSHYDHLDARSVRALARQPSGPPHFAVPLGLERWFARRVRGLPAGRVTALDWWECMTIAGLLVTLAPVHHWSARTPWDRNTSLWGGWSIEGEDGFRFFFSGDIAYSDDSREIGRRLGPFDLAAIAIGHYEPRWFMRGSHVNPEEAVRVHREIRSRRSLAIHFGTFELTAEPLDQPLKDLAAARAEHGVGEDEFFSLRHGETRRLD